MLPTESNTPGAVVPNPQPGAPIAGGLRIVSAQATPLVDYFSNMKKGAVNVRFNGAATTRGYVNVSAVGDLFTAYTSAGSATFVPGQTEVQVPISVNKAGPGEVPLKVSIQGSSAEFQTMTYYRAKP